MSISPNYSFQNYTNHVANFRWLAFPIHVLVQKIKEKIGKGAYATVYRAEYDNGESIAVKSIDTSGISHENLDLIMIEVKLLKNLDHPNIVKYYGFKQTLKHANIILEYCENGSLADMCKSTGKFPNI